MLRYQCQHCLADLGEYVDGLPQPACEFHPDGVVEIVEDYANTDD